MSGDGRGAAQARHNRRGQRLLLSLFDIRNIVGALLAIYGVLLTVAGFVPAILPAHNDKPEAHNRVDLYVGTHANWWVGLILLGVAVAFFAWALARPHRFDEVGTLEPKRSDE